MYKIGDKLVYGRNGVCEVVDITERVVPETGESKPYYVLKTFNDRCKIYSPVDNSTVFMRAIISKAEAEKLIALIPSIPADVYHTSKPAELAEHYSTILNTHDIKALAALTKSIYTKRLLAEDQKGKYGAVDKHFIEQAEDKLF
ncbi:MAG: CarD family transcriptional regulator, partial [Coriobacteriales bacterium]|nr:CarD family transcriptional regulator [Coriobacteriales bacterium]